MTRSMLAHLESNPGQGDRIASLIKDLEANVRMEPGNIAFLAYRHTNNADRFEMFEAYESDEAFHQHLSTPYVKSFNEQLKRLARNGKSDVIDLTPMMSQAPSRSAVRGLDHVGITVPDIDAASKFFCAAFGAVTLYDVVPRESEPMAGPGMEHQLGLPVGSKIVRMRLMRVGESATFELFQLSDVEHQPAVIIAGFGGTHLAFYVDNMEEATRQFEAAGGVLLSDPHALASQEQAANNRGVYGRAPWGTLIELLTYPDGIQYPAQAQAHRWTPPIRQTA